MLLSCDCCKISTEKQIPSITLPASSTNSYVTQPCNCFHAFSQMSTDTEAQEACSKSFDVWHQPLRRSCLMDPPLASSVYYVSASLRQAVLSLSVIVCHRDVALSRAAGTALSRGAVFWDGALVTQGTRGGKWRMTSVPGCSYSAASQNAPTHRRAQTPTTSRARQETRFTCGEASCSQFRGKFLM